MSDESTTEVYPLLSNPFADRFDTIRDVAFPFDKRYDFFVTKSASNAIDSNLAEDGLETTTFTS
jgi:hypothetical protein